MSDEIRKALGDAGIDVDDLMDRLMGNMNLISKFCKRFPDDLSYGKMLEGINAGDVEMAFQGAHSLKGVSANLSMKSLVAKLVPVVEKLRAGELDGVEEMLPAVTAEYQRVVEVIKNIQW